MSKIDVDLLLGKVPPQAVEQEGYVLGVMMMEPEKVDTVFSIIKTPNAFYREAHQKIAQVIWNMRENHIQIDISTVTQECHKAQVLDQVGGPSYITQLTTPIASGAHVEQYCTYVVDSYIKRELIRIAGNTSSHAFDPSKDADDIINDLEINLREVEVYQAGSSGSHISVAVNESEELVREMATGRHTILRQTGLKSFDDRFGGFMPSKFIVIAARPSMGKTSLALSIARNMAAHYPVGIFSLEMAQLELVNSLISAEGMFNNHAFMEKMDQDTTVKYNQAKEIIGKLPIYIDDNPNLNYIELRRKARMMVKDHGVKVIFVDYIQLMSGVHKKDRNRENEVSEISRNMKIIAKELNISVIGLAQLNRSVEQRAGTNIPRLSDLRESGAIEQDADMVIFIYRAEQYGIDLDEEGMSTKGVAKIIVAKNRTGGPCGSVNAGFIDYCTRFVDSEDAVYSVDQGERLDFDNLQIEFDDEL